MPARNNRRMHLPFFCKSVSECEYTFGITITVLKISQNNDNRGHHLEFYSHTGIGNWFQCFPVYPGLNLSSGSGSGSVSVSGSGSGFQIPAFPYALRLSRKGGYFQHWLEYSIAFEVLETREKLNTVLSSWETFEDLRKCWPSLHESKLRLNTCCGRFSCWISSGTESWLNQRQLEQTKSMPVVFFKESLVERTVSKENSKSMQSKELFACSSGLSRNKTFIKCSYICRIC